MAETCVTIASRAPYAGLRRPPTGNAVLVPPTVTPVRPAAVPARTRAAALGPAVRFLVVGGVATAVDVGLYNALHSGLHVGPLTAKVASTLVSGAVAFVGNRQWSFAGSGGRMRSQVLPFVAVNVVGLLLALLPLAVARYALGLTGVVALNVAGNVIGLGVATAWRFWAYRRWVFPPAAAATAGSCSDVVHTADCACPPERLAA